MSAFFQPGHVEGALANGTRVHKTNSKPGDTHADGALATVLSSVCADPREGVGYFVEWDSHPGVPVLIHESRIEAVP